MITLDINNKNDIFAQNGQLQTTKDIYALSNTLKQKISTLKGELIFDIDKGIPYKDIIWSSPPNIAQAESYIRDAILEKDEVIDIKSLTVFVNNNIFNYNTTIITIYGEVNFGI